MDNLINFISSNILFLFIFGFILLIFFGIFRRNKLKQTDGNLGIDSEKALQSKGVTHYSGNTGGMDWTLKSIIQPGRRGAWMRCTQWQTKSISLPAGKFIMMISAQGYESAKHPIKRGGFVNDLVNKAADLALDIYVASYFGTQYCSLVNIGSDGAKIERPELQDFMILTNDEPLAQKYFDDSTTQTISNWKNSNQGFAGEGRVDLFGLLFAPDGVMLSCQTNMTTPREVQMFSDFGAALTSKMKGIRG
jgi:hypothetical protein